MKRFMRAGITVVVLAGASVAFSGCATVKPYQRGLLAHPMMSFDPQEDPSAALEGGVYAVNYNEHSVVYAGGGAGGVAAGCPSCK